MLGPAMVRFGHGGTFITYALSVSIMELDMDYVKQEGIQSFEREISSSRTTYEIKV
jgi:tryptophan synthase beta subunit